MREQGCRTWLTRAGLCVLCSFPLLLSLGGCSRKGAAGTAAGVGHVDGLTLVEGKYLTAAGWVVGSEVGLGIKKIRFYASQAGGQPLEFYEDTPIRVPRPDVIQALARPGIEKTLPGWALPLSRLYGKIPRGEYRVSAKAVMDDGQVVDLIFSSAAQRLTVP